VGRTLVLALLMAGLVLAGLEIVARTPLARSHLIAPGVGENHDHLAIKLQQLDGLAAQGQPVECIALGSSMVAQGFDPQAFSSGFERATGEPLACYNFGLIGMTTAGLDRWTALVVQRYHPRIVIIGNSARDLSNSAALDQEGLNIQPPWLAYQLGESSPEGWLVEHSMAYRYYLFHRFWLWDGYAERVRRLGNYQRNLSPYGYARAADITDVSVTPDPQTYPRLYRMLTSYAPSAEQVRALERAVGVAEQDATVILVEMPLPPTFWHFFDNGERDYRLYLDVMERIAADNGLPFVRTIPDLAIPPDGWGDYAHLNGTGAAVFSEWLGQAVAGLLAEN
jgi:hypothetical protein